MRVLVVDHDVASRDALQTVLADCSASITCADDGMAALEELAIAEFDVVVSDVPMPRMDGLLLCRAIRSNPRHDAMAFVFLTGASIDPGDEERAYAYGADAFVRAPAAPEAILAAVREAVARSVERQAASLADVDRAQRATRDVGASLARYAALVDASADALVSLDPVRRVATWSAAAARLFGLEAREVVGRRLTDVLDEGSHEQFQSALDAARESGQVRRSLVLTVPGDREVRGRATIAFLGDEIGWSLVLDDGAGAQAARAALADSEQRLARVVRAGATVVYTLELVDGQLVGASVTENVERLYGFTVAEVLEPDWWATHVHPDDLDAALETARGALTTGHAAHEYRFRRKDGKVRWILDELTRLDGGSRGRSAVVGAWTDITQLKAGELERERLRGRLELAQKMEAVGQLAGGIAHDFNNMLTVILGYAGLLEARGTLPETDLRVIREIREASERSAALTRQLLAFGRREIAEPQPIDVNLVVRSMRELLRRLVPASIDVEVDLEPELPTVVLDPTQLHQVILNLVVNARDAMPDGGRLTIQTVRSDAPTGATLVTLVVSDAGVGMDAATVARIFEPAFTTKPRGVGTGLGLATVQAIVTANGGTIDVLSEPGRGSTFHLSFPSSSAVVEDDPEPAPARVAGGGKTVVVVEDERPVLQLAADLLIDAGYTVLCASNAAEALEIVRRPEQRVDLVLTDVVMPGQSGTQLAGILRAERPDVRILLMSGYSRGDWGESAAEDPAPRLKKPFDRASLLVAVGSALA